MLNGVPRILIIRLSAIGDVVRVLPALHSLRHHYPNAQIDWAIEKKSQDIVLNHPALDRVLIFNRPKGFSESIQEFRRFCREIKENRYDMVLDFHGLLKSGLITRASRAPQRFGFAPPRSRELSFLFYKKKLKLESSYLNRVDENLQLAELAGATKTEVEAIISIKEDTAELLDQYYAETFHSGKKIVIVHAPVDRPEKQWPLDYFAQLSDMILADGRYEVLLTWGPGQRAIAEEVSKTSKRSPVVAPETPDLKHYAALVQRADLYFGGDTGPMHIATAMSTPVVAVFGGTDPAKHAPMREPHRVLYEGPRPAPKKFELATAQKNLRKITPEQAYDACVELLR